LTPTQDRRMYAHGGNANECVYIGEIER
jgi:hypothetical protein